MTAAKKNSPTAPSAKRLPGRPRKEHDRLTVNLQVRVTQDTAEACKRLGGPDFMRPVLQAAVRAADEELGQNRARSAAARTARKILSPLFRPAANEPSVTFVDMGAQCGFPSPAFDYATQELSLNDYFFKHPDATYIVQATGDSMIDAGIQEGDILMIDRSLEPKSGDIVLAVINGEFTVKRLKIVDGAAELHPENRAANYPVIRPGEFDGFEIEGVLVGSGRRY